MELVATANSRVASSVPLSLYAARSSLPPRYLSVCIAVRKLGRSSGLSASLRINILSRKHVT